MEDLSHLAKDSLTVRAGSMAATNTVSVVPDFGAPGTGSESVNANDVEPVQPVAQEYSNETPIATGTSGKPQAEKQQGWHPAAPAWKPTTVPEVVRET